MVWWGPEVYTRFATRAYAVREQPVTANEERFPPPKLNAGCGFRQQTIAGMRRNGRDAPSAVIPALAPERGSSTRSGHPPVLLDHLVGAGED